MAKQQQLRISLNKVPTDPNEQPEPQRVLDDAEEPGKEVASGTRNRAAGH